MTNKLNLDQLCREIHADNVTAGWWTDLISGESLVGKRNVGEMLMLSVTELSEAADGIDLRADDKLPDRCMFDVEIADYVIRLLDQIGSEVAQGAAMPKFWDQCSSPYRRFSWSDQLVMLVQQSARAMEHHRKSRISDYVQAMADGVTTAFAIADANGINLAEVIAEKRAFNATRADHKPENRRAADGKKV